MVGPPTSDQCGQNSDAHSNIPQYTDTPQMDSIASVTMATGGHITMLLADCITWSFLYGDRCYEIHPSEDATHQWYFTALGQKWNNHFCYRWTSWPNDAVKGSINEIISRLKDDRIWIIALYKRSHDVHMCVRRACFYLCLFILLLFSIDIVATISKQFIYFSQPMHLPLAKSP